MISGNGEKTGSIVESLPTIAVSQDAEVGKRCYTVEEVQVMLGIGRIAVYKLIRQNCFRTLRIGGGAYRIVKSSFDAWLENGLEEGVEDGGK